MPIKDTATDRYRALIQLLRTAEDLWNASRIFFEKWDLSPSQFNVLNLLHARPEGLSQSDLSRLLIMHRSNATGLIDRLTRRGLVQRTDDAQDRRAYKVILTAAGNALLDRIYPHYYAAAERVWADLPDERVTQLIEELQNVTANAAAVAVLASTPPPTEPPVPKPTHQAPKAPPSAPPEAAPPGAAADSSLRVSDL